jgi:hypothetical protein
MCPIFSDTPRIRALSIKAGQPIARTEDLLGVFTYQPQDD